MVIEFSASEHTTCSISQWHKSVKSFDLAIWVLSIIVSNLDSSRGALGGDIAARAALFFIMSIVADMSGVESFIRCGISGVIIFGLATATLGCGDDTLVMGGGGSGGTTSVSGPTGTGTNADSTIGCVGDGCGSHDGNVPCQSDDDCMDPALPFCHDIDEECVICDDLPNDQDARCEQKYPNEPLCSAMGCVAECSEAVACPVGELCDDGKCKSCTEVDDGDGRNRLCEESSDGAEPICDDGVCRSCVTHQDCNYDVDRDGVEDAWACHLDTGKCFDADSAVIEVSGDTVMGESDQFLDEAMSTLSSLSDDSIIVRIKDVGPHPHAGNVEIPGSNTPGGFKSVAIIPASPGLMPKLSSVGDQPTLAIGGSGDLHLYLDHLEFLDANTPGAVLEVETAHMVYLEGIFVSSNQKGSGIRGMNMSHLVINNSVVVRTGTLPESSSVAALKIQDVTSARINSATIVYNGEKSIICGGNSEARVFNSIVHTAIGDCSISKEPSCERFDLENSVVEAGCSAGRESIGSSDTNLLIGDFWDEPRPKPLKAWWDCGSLGDCDFELACSAGELLTLGKWTSPLFSPRPGPGSFPSHDMDQNVRPYDADVAHHEACIAGGISECTDAVGARIPAAGSCP